MNSVFFNILSIPKEKPEDLNQREEMKFNSDSTKGSIEEIYSNETLF